MYMYTTCIHVHVHVYMHVVCKGHLLIHRHTHVPLHLFGVLLLPSLGLHLLHLNSVRLSAAHVELVITHAQSQDTLVDAETRGIEDKVLGRREGGREGGRREGGREVREECKGRSKD